MTIHEVLYAPAGQVVATVCLLLVTLQINLVFASFRNERNWKIKLLYLLHFLVTFFIFYMILCDIDWDIVYPEKMTPLPSFMMACLSLPIAVLLLYEVLTALTILIEMWDLLRYRKNHPTFESIKETMDLLPAGIAFGKPDGTVVFRNVAINDLSRSLTGRGITDLADFRKAVIGEQPDPGDRIQVTLPDGSGVWQLTREYLDVDGEPFTQLTATDITEQAAVTKELEEKNEKLREFHMRLDIYNKQAERIIIAQELLTARMAVHNEVGNVLLESRHYLKDPSSIDEKVLLQALKNTNTYLLREYEEDDTERDPLMDAMEMAEAIGVDVMITGRIPTEDPYRTILAAAINECATNTIKHSNGDHLTVNIQSVDSSITYVLQTNGIQPTEPIREVGGLLSLRTLVEQEKGKMETAISPSYLLTIRLPVID